MSESHWRNAARETIERVKNEHPSADKETLRKLLRAAYPFYERKYHPYKIWCDEVRIALGDKRTPRASELERLKQWNENARGFAK